MYGKKKLHLNYAGKSLLANNFIKYFVNMWLTKTIRADSDMSLPHLTNDVNQNKVPTSSSNTDKIIDSDLEADLIPFGIKWYN